MLSAAATGGQVRLDGELPPSTAAYLDAEWLPTDGEGPVPALVVEEGSWIGWEGQRAALPSGLSGYEAAAAVLWRLAEAAARLAADRPPGPVEVTGEGALAASVRQILAPAAPPAPTEGPAAVIDTTGNPETIASATERLRDSGVLVLAGETHGRPVPLNLYPDVHARGLRLRGVAPRLNEPIAQAKVPDDLRASLREVRQGEPAPAGKHGWLRVAPS